MIYKLIVEFYYKQTMDKYISESPFKTAPMKVTVTNMYDEHIKSYDVPPGFQLERYLSDLHPTLSLEMRLSSDKFCVKILDGNNLIETHTGIYQQK